jgi:hypothetical protein
MDRVYQTYSKAPEMRLVPHSGIQFVVLGFNLTTSAKVSREFFGRKRLDQRRPDGTVPMELLPAWNETDPDGEPPYIQTADDEDYVVSKEKAVETFLDQWFPVPFLAVRPGLDEQGEEILEAGPLNWVRAKISQVEDASESSAHTHHLVFAYDTEILEKVPKVGYVAPTPDDVRNERSYAFAHRFRDVSRFLQGSEADENGRGRLLSWVDAWVFGTWLHSRQSRLGRRLREEEKKTVEHLAHYITLLEFLARAVGDLPRIQLVDTYSEEARSKPVQVDLVLDLGNSRTCGILIETYPNDPQARFENAMVLGLRDLDAPYNVFREPFESHIELAQAYFGPEHLGRETRVRSFFWPSPVRTGPEATRYRDAAEGTEASSGMSSPKRYLCDVAPVNQEWRFQPGDYDVNGNPPIIDRAIRQLVNCAGDVLRQVKDDVKFYRSLAQSVGYEAKLEDMARQLTYSRSSMFTFMVAEIVAQTISMINNPQLRAVRRDRDAPRQLRRIILSLPTAMPIQEQRIMRSRALAAVKLVWDLMKWTTSPQASVRNPPDVHVSWDEATCTQMVYLYNEIVQKYGGNLEEFFDLVGRPRRRIDPEKPVSDPQRLPEERSLRIASVDVGGGTADLMVTTYYIDGGKSLMPIQNFREGFRIAGDEVLREVIQLAVIPPVEKALRAAGVNDARTLLRDRFAGNDAGMTVQEQQIRRQFVLQVFEPAALAVLRAAETATPESETRTASLSLRQILTDSALNGGAPAANGTKLSDDKSAKAVLPDRTRSYLEKIAGDRGARGFSVEDVEIPIDTTQVRNAVNAALGDVFDCMSEAINVLDCDVVLLSGRPSRLPATIDLFVDKLAVTPDRVVPLSEYQVDKWYPFTRKTSFRIGDPKTATVVGSLLCVLVDRQITNFRVDTRRFGMRSTAKFIGEMDNDGKIRDSRILFRWSNEPAEKVRQESHKLQYYARVRLGYRQLDLERWIATPLYRLKMNEGGSLDRMPNPPFEITLGRRDSDEEVSLDDKRFADKFAASEALKEQLVVTDVQALAGDGPGGLARRFSLQLDTLPSQDGYWLDTGILTVASSG